MRKLPFFTHAAVLVTAALSGLFVAGTASAQPTINFVTTGAITLDDPVENGRIVRDGDPSVYTTNKDFPGVIDTSLYHYDTYSFTNTNSFAEPIFITLSTTGTFDVFSEAYLTYFNPTALDTNYRGDAGNSPEDGTPSPYSILVPANTTFVVIVNEVNPDAGAPSYTLTVTSVPEPSTWALLGLSITGTGVIVLRRRRTLV